MSRQVSPNAADWTEEDVLYLFQYDQRTDEVKTRAEELGVQLPGPQGVNAPIQAGTPEAGLPCPTCGVVYEPPEPGTWSGLEAEEGSYESMTKEQLKEELDSQGIEYLASDNKAELIARLEGE